MYRVSIELYKHEWKFGRTRNAVGTRAAGECFHSYDLLFVSDKGPRFNEEEQSDFSRQLITN